MYVLCLFVAVDDELVNVFGLFVDLVFQVEVPVFVLEGLCEEGGGEDVVFECWVNVLEVFGVGCGCGQQVGDVDFDDGARWWVHV